MSQAYRGSYPLLALCSALLVTLTACANGHADTGEPAIGPVPAVRSDAEIVLPVDTYFQTIDQQHTVTNAVNLLGRMCMKRFGLDWPASPATARDNRPRNTRRYTILDPAKAAAEGYHAPDVTRQQQAIKAEVAGQPVPSEAAMLVWAGRGSDTYNGRPVPKGGCAKEAMAVLTQGVPPADPAVADRLQLDSFVRTMKDSRVVAAFAAWRSCMKAQGFDYQEPFAANDDVRWRTEQISKLEIATAVADVNCKVQARVAGTMLAVEIAYQQRLFHKHGGELDAVKAYHEAQVANAARLISGERP